MTVTKWIPSEAEEQQALIAWARLMYFKQNEVTYRISDFIFHIPNGGHRDHRTGALLKKAGVMAGVYDLFLMVPRGGFHGLFLEMKRKGGVVSVAQQAFGKKVATMGYKEEVVYGCEEGIKSLKSYLELTE